MPGLGLTLSGRPRLTPADNPLTSFLVHGDSTAAGTGATVRWFDTLGAGYDPDRLVVNFGVGGQGIATMRAKMVGDQSRAAWTTIIYDRRNVGEDFDAATYLNELTTAVATLTGRFLIMPQVYLSDGAETAPNQAVMDTINAGIRSTWPGNTFDATLEGTFQTALQPGSTRADGLHRNNAGQAIEAATIRSWLDGKGW